MSVRLRFAPSNTGFLHMGNARTALFNYLYTRHHKGTFILRIEDTDLERSKPEYTDAILEAMDWMGMEADEGPFFQTKRTDIYKEKVEELLASGNAYKCFATKEELEERRQKAMESGGDLSAASRIWRDRDDHPEGQPFVVRFKSPLEGDLTIDDMVQGEVTVSATELDDFIILRSDGTPTYNFTVVVDDILMEVTHIVRGDDHLNNAFRQLPVYLALGAKPPRFGHVALVAGLSKRKGSTSVPEYRALGYLREAVNNYLARLGWSHGDQEIFSMEELIEYFDFDHVGKSASQFDIKKFQWVNAEWMKRLEPAVLAERWLPFLAEAGLPAPSVDSPEFARLTEIAEALSGRAKTLVEMTEKGAFFFTDSVEYDEKAASKWLVQKYADAFDELHTRLSALEDWTTENIEAIYRDLVEKYELGLKHFAQPTRVCLTGSTSSPGVFETVALCGRERVLERLAAGVERMKAAE
ncbi:glutamate--tRNA ligase [Bradymonas sediminis]|uniref:Glutamate--tRNA ligase n=1 Tax=Bradymonas sediminis TaxID=1548548 RepID=A0A2Z4FJ20_9DELT|nr:glutamate--tRNA ligase [Bradymonas sediminis]AWV88932.1 glutamate--tRNA ligase [Bradymonas sediminis]TDP71941.1 glutamyl-tRNA synthetase [Bradymonas sediminis]